MGLEAVRGDFLIIDDDDGLRELIRWVLSDEGYSVVEASSVAEFRQLMREMRQQRKSPVASFVDYDLKHHHTTGFEIARGLKLAFPTSGVGLVSASVGEFNPQREQQFRRLQEQGIISQVLSKPFELDSLYNTVQKLVTPQLISIK